MKKTRLSILAVVFISLVLAVAGTAHVAEGNVSADERAALVDLYNDTAGGSWSTNTNWLTGDPCVDAWSGVTCDIVNTTVTQLQLNSNNLDGGIPPAFGNLTSLFYLLLSNNQLTGTIPTEIGNLTGLRYLYLDNNQLTGTITAWVGNLTILQFLYLSNNQLMGSIPDSIINLDRLQYLRLYSNKLSGEVPAGITNNVLIDNGSDFRYNALYATDVDVTSFLDLKQSATTFAATQTVAPTDLTFTIVNSTSVDLDWTAVTYTADPGGYEIWNSTTAGGPYSWLMNTVDKNVITNTITGLTPGTDDYFVLKTWTDPHGNNGNKVVSDYSAEATATTTGGGGGGGGGDDDDGDDDGGGDGGCFIATAAYGSYADEHVMLLREFRDKHLLTNAAGRELVDAYYAYAPPIADFIAEHGALKVATRFVLTPVVYTVKHPGLVLLLMGFVVAGAGESVRRGRHRRRRK